MAFQLKISTGLQAGRALALAPPELRIGRGAENDLVLLDTGISRRHLTLFERDGAWRVQDVGSANGTELNGAPLTQERELKDGDLLRLGPVELHFCEEPREERTRIVAVPAPKPSVPARVRAAALAPVPRAGARDEPTAAERARKRRAAGTTLGGQLWLAWEGLGRRNKALVVAGALALLLGMGGTLLALPGPGPAEVTQDLGPEPSELSATPLPGSFGLGPGVTWQRADMKAFRFAFTAPTRAVALLRYRAQGISREEVEVSVNGVEQGWVAPDVGGASDREQELVLPPSVLKRNASNELLFDNVRNPPGRDPWRIEGVRVEIIPVPELPPEELLASARESVAKARGYAQQRAVGSENLFRAWKNYRAAWVTLEALDSRPELYRDVRFALGQVSSDLDRECARLMLELQRGVQYRDAGAVRRAFEDVLRHFPTTEHRCHTLALEQRSRYSL